MKWSLLLLLCFFFGCHSQPKSENTVSINILEPPSQLDPRMARTVPDMNVMKMLFEGVTREDPNGEVQLALAQEITHSDDGLIYTFKLRPSLWSTGLPVTASDFVTSWSEILTPNFPAPYASLLYCIKNGEKVKKGKLPVNTLGLKVIDSLTFQITLEHPTPYLLKLLALPPFYPVPANAYDPTPSHYVGNGPFLVNSWKEFDLITLKKNPNYWDTHNVSLDGVNLFMVSEHTEEGLFDETKLHWSGSPITYLSSETIPTLKATNQVKFTPALGTHFFACNTQVPPFDNPNVRKAFAYALNRTALITHVLQGGQTPAMGFLPPPLTLTKQPYFKDFQPELARQLFAKAFVGQEIPEITFIYATNERNHKIAQTVQQQWNRVFGIQVKIVSLETKLFFDTLQKGNFQLANASWIGDFQDPINFLELFKEKDSPLNKSKWENTAFQNHLKTSHSTTNVKERNKAFLKAESVLMNEMPIIPLFYYTFSYREAPNLKNAYLSPIGQLDFRWATLEPETK